MRIDDDDNELPHPADAALIQAAPELLEALRWAMGNLRKPEHLTKEDFVGHHQAKRLLELLSYIELERTKT